MKDIKKVKQGKKNRASGSAFELRVRKDLESKGWIVDKWSNNIELEKITIKSDAVIRDDGSLGTYLEYENEIGKIVPSKRKYLGPGKPMAIGTGFPDFVCMSKVYGEFSREDGSKIYGAYDIIGVESKSNGVLDKEEKEKCKWLLKNNIFREILIAEKTKVKNKVVIVYHNFDDKYGRN